MPITSIVEAKEAFPGLRWRDDESSEEGRVAFAICGGDKETGDITILLAMEDGARAPLHRHNEREGWPFRESLTCFVGKLHGIKPHDSGFILHSGRSIDLANVRPHAPFVQKGTFCLVQYRQPAGHTVVKDAED